MKIAYVAFQGWLPCSPTVEGMEVRIVLDPGITDRTYYERCVHVGPDALGESHVIWERLVLEPVDEVRLLRLYLKRLEWPKEPQS